MIEPWGGSRPLGDNGTRSRRVVVGVSLSLGGLQALRYGVGEARQRHATLHAVRAYGFRPPWAGPDVARVRADLAAEARSCVRGAFDVAMAGPPSDVSVQVETPDERTDLALVRIAADPLDLLVLGAPTTGWRPNWIIRGCLRRAVCPVVLVPPPRLSRSGRVSMRRLLREISELGPTAI